MRDPDGKLLSANKILLGELSKVDDTMYVTARVVDVAKGIADHAEKCVIRESDKIDIAVSKISIKLMDSMAERTERGFTFTMGPLITGPRLPG
jgi:hypothetical protein